MSIRLDNEIWFEFHSFDTKLFVDKYLQIQYLLGLARIISVWMVANVLLHLIDRAMNSLPVYVHRIIISDNSGVIIKRDING